MMELIKKIRYIIFSLLLVSCEGSRKIIELSPPLKGINTELFNKNLKELHVRGIINDVGKANFDTIPKSILHAENLRALYLTGIGIKTIPPFLSKLERLHTLDLSENQELSLNNIGLLSNLKSLNLNGCNIEKIPDKILKLKKLRVLGLSSNNLSSIERKRILALVPAKCKVYF